MKGKKFVTYATKKFSTNENDKNEIKLYRHIRHHCHYTKKFRGAAHSIYNLRYKTPKETPIVFQNGYTYNTYYTYDNL